MDLKQAEIPLPCPKCGAETKRTMKQLSEKLAYYCFNCGIKIDINLQGDSIDRIADAIGEVEPGQITVTRTDAAD